MAKGLLPTLLTLDVGGKEFGNLEMITERQRGKKRNRFVLQYYMETTCTLGYATCTCTCICIIHVYKYGCT